MHPCRVDKIKSEQATEGKNKQIQEAKKFIDKAFQYHKDNPQAYYVSGKFHAITGKKKEAKQDFLKIISFTDKYFEAYYMLSEIEYGEQRYAQALEYVNKARKLNPKFIELYFRRGCTYLHLNKVAEAKKDFASCIRRMKHYNAGSLLRYAYDLMEDRYHQQAEIFYRAVFRKNKRYTKKLQEQEEKSNGSSGFYAIQYNRIKRQNSDAYVGLAVIFGEYRRQYQKSLDCCKKAIVLNDKSFKAWYNKGCILQKLGKLEKAIKCYNKATKLEDTDHTALYNKSMVLLKQKKYEEAIQMANKVLKLKPKHLDGIIVKANALFYLRRYKRAIQVYTKAITNFPESDVGYHGAGLCYSWLKEDEKAVEYNKKAIVLNPQNYHAMSNLGNNFCNLGKYKKALEILDRGIAQNTEYYHSYYVKACVYALTGKNKKAFEMIRKTLQCDPAQKENLRKEKDFKSIKKLWEFKKIFET